MLHFSHVFCCTTPGWKSYNQPHMYTCVHEVQSSLCFWFILLPFCSAVIISMKSWTSPTAIVTLWCASVILSWTNTTQTTCFEHFFGTHPKGLGIAHTIFLLTSTHLYWSNEHSLQGAHVSHSSLRSEATRLADQYTFSTLSLCSHPSRNSFCLFLSECLYTIEYWWDNWPTKLEFVIWFNVIQLNSSHCLSSLVWVDMLLLFLLFCFGQWCSHWLPQYAATSYTQQSHCTAAWCVLTSIVFTIEVSQSHIAQSKAVVLDDRA